MTLPIRVFRMPTILIIDDNLLARIGLKHLLNGEYRELVFGDAATEQEAAALFSQRSWDLGVVDIAIAAPKGFQFLREIRQSHPSTRVLVMGTHANTEHAFQARQIGASGYVGKNASRADLVRAFSSVLDGNEYFLDPLPEKGEASLPHLPALSARERHVLAAFVAGKRVGEIAADMHLSIKTVSTYKRRILNKLQLKSVADLVRHAIDHNLCDPLANNSI